jgi:N,N'-diacetylchitobiose transport system permease protein
MASSTIITPGAPTPVTSRRMRLRRGRVSAVAGRSRTATNIFNAIGLVFAAVMFFPIYWMINTAFKPPDEVLNFTPHLWPYHPTLQNFISAFRAEAFLTDLKNSLVITCSAVLGGLLVGFLGSLAIARFRFYGRRSLVLIILIVQMVPFTALVIPLYLMLNSVQLTDSLPGIILVYLILILPYTVWMLRGFIVNVPRELDEAALVDGCTRWQTFYRIILPLTGPGLVAASIYGFIQCWNEFLIINSLNHSPEKQNLMVWLASNQTLRGTAWGPLMAGAIVAALPVVVLFLIIQKNVAAGLTAGAVKG